MRPLPREPWMQGAATNHLGLTPEILKGAVKALFVRKGEEIAHLNLAALEAGKKGFEFK